MTTQHQRLCTNIAGIPTETTPNKRERRAGLNLIWLVHGGFWAKSEVPSSIFLALRKF
jgi:hypothetical protein